MSTSQSDRTAPGAGLPDADAALLDLLRLLRERNYRFVCPTPETHRRVVARPDRQQASSVADVLGWSLPFGSGVLDPAVETLLEAAGAIERCGVGQKRARLRVSSLGDGLFLHSAYPTHSEDAVFLGPDSYRFADLIRAELERSPPPPGARLVDIGTGAGVGAIVAATACPGLAVAGTDLNPQAVRLARINAAAAGIDLDLALGRGLAPAADPIDLVTANPPYIIDEAGRLYRDGGGLHGGQVSLDMAAEALGRLAPGGRLILYTGSAIVRGADRLRAELADLAEANNCRLAYREIDPDVFGEELDHDAYRDVERIALVAALIEQPS